MLLESLPFLTLQTRVSWCYVTQSHTRFMFLLMDSHKLHLHELGIYLLWDNMVLGLFSMFQFSIFFIVVSSTNIFSFYSTMKILICLHMFSCTNSSFSKQIMQLSAASSRMVISSFQLVTKLTQPWNLPSQCMVEHDIS